ncbi:unnamed protein product [Urochloa humidicola]
MIMLVTRSHHHAFHYVVFFYLQLDDTCTVATFHGALAWCSDHTSSNAPSSATKIIASQFAKKKKKKKKKTPAGLKMKLFFATAG